MIRNKITEEYICWDKWKKRRGKIYKKITKKREGVSENKGKRWKDGDRRELE